MLDTLQIENVATIEAVTVRFRPGLNILTGETGAGKSILIDSIHAVLGQKTSRELIRTGASAASVRALFTDTGAGIRQRLLDMGLPAEEDGTLQLHRRLLRDGKNACYINGAPVTVSMLKSVAGELISIQGQRDTGALLDADRHVEFLDAYAGDAEALAAYRASFERCRALRARIRALSMDEAEKARRTDLLQYQIAEIAGADPKPGETEALRRQRSAIQNAAKVQNALAYAIAALEGDGEAPGADGLIETAVRQLIGVSDVATGVGEVASLLEGARDTVSQAASLLDDALAGLSGSESRLDEIGERLDLLYRLSRKYGPTEEEMLRFLENAQKELGEIESAEGEIERLNGELEAQRIRLDEAAKRLSSLRKTAAEKLSAAIQRELSYLDMPRVTFAVHFAPSALRETGAEQVSFLLSANPGEEPRPLVKVASGGELSRVMLAMKNALNMESPVTSLIFDEIDAGVSGSAAGKIAQKLWALSVGSQVLCVTHSAQIASFADAHKRIEKKIVGDKTYTGVVELTGEERAKELARITFGPEATDTQVDSARQMIARAAGVKARGKTPAGA